MPFEVSDFPDLLARLPARFCSTKSASLHNMKPKRERSNGVGPSRLGCISSPLHVHRKEGLLPVPDECWILYQDSWYARRECNQFDFSSSRSPRSFVALDIPSKTRYICGSLRRLQMGWELWRLGLEAETWFRPGIGWQILLSCTQDHKLWIIQLHNNRSGWGGWVVFYNVEDAMHLL